jgi:uncharacterized protein
MNEFERWSESLGYIVTKVATSNNTDKPTNMSQGFHVLVKPTGALCNLNCSYCYFLSNKRLYSGSSFRMADEVLEAYLNQYLAAQQETAVIAWQGGEPTLMGLDFFYRAIALERQVAPPGLAIEHTLQTNGTLIDEAWCEFFRENHFLIGLSLDGPKELHDEYRRDIKGGATFDRVMHAATLLSEHGVDFNVLAAVHAANANYPLDVYRFLRDEVGTQFIQFIPIVERGNATGFQEGDAVTERAITADQWGRFLIDIFDKWVRRDVGHVYVQFFDAALAAWAGKPSPLCIFAPTCGTALVLEHNGDIYSCDHFVEPAFLLGNILDTPLRELATSDKQLLFGLAKAQTLPRDCLECPVRFACHGECPKNRFITTPDGDPGLNYLCAGYKAFFTHIDRPMRIMADLLHRDQAPAEIMRVYAAEDERRLQKTLATARRNDPCPCGSGQKFKRCHGAPNAKK